MKIVHLVLAASAAGMVAVPALAQTGPVAPAAPAGPAPGSGNAAGMSDRTREENASYNRVVGTVGSKPVEQEQAKKAKAKSKAVPATAADITAGAALRDIDGKPLGTIESADAEGAIVAYGTGKVKVPLSAFGKDDQGLLLGTTSEKFMALVSKAGSGS